jgi:hypothetical protein
MMKNKLILGSASLLTGMLVIFFAVNSDPSASADVLALDPLATARFQLVLIAGVILVVISFILFALAITRSNK